MQVDALALPRPHTLQRSLTQSHQPTSSLSCVNLTSTRSRPIPCSPISSPLRELARCISPRSPDWCKCIAVNQPEVSPPPAPQSTDGADQCLVKLKAPPFSWKPHRVSQRSLDRDCFSKWSHTLTGTGPETSCWSRSYAKPRRRRRVSATLAKTRVRRKVWYLHWTIDWGHCTALLRHKLLGHIRPIQQWLSNLIAQLLFPTRSCRGRQ